MLNKFPKQYDLRTMFCSSCGEKIVQAGSFCHKCGTAVPTTCQKAGENVTTNENNGATSSQGEYAGKTPSRLPAGSGPPIMTFHEFRGIKEKDRQGHFRNKVSKKRKVDVNTDSPTPKVVTIKVGIMTYREDTGTLKPVRGSLLAVSMPLSSNSNDVKAKAVEKLSRFNQAVSKYPSVYHLLYPDFTRVEKLPGSEENFSLVRYKEELGKPYERITLYLCKAIDYLSNEGIFLTDSDGEDAEDFKSESNIDIENNKGSVHGTSTSFKVHNIGIQLCANEQNVESEEVEHACEAAIVPSNSHDINQDSGNPSDLDCLYASLLFDEVNSDLIESGINSDITDNESANADLATISNVDDAVEENHEAILKNILEQKSQTICKSQISKFNICRNNIWEGTKRSMLRKSFSPSNKLSVKFTDDIGFSEGAVDLGGPMREFMTSVLEYLMGSQLFIGSTNSKLLSCNGRCLEESEYFLAGQLIAMSLVHIGIGPRCLSPILFECLIGYPEKVSVSVEDVCDPELRDSLQELFHSKTIEEAQEMMKSPNLETLLDLSGNFKVIRNLCDVKKVVNSTVSWIIMGRTRAALESFKEGLSSLGILSSITENPLAFKSEMCYKEQLITNEMISNLFCVSRSEIGSNRYELESLLLSFWEDLLVDIQEGEISLSYSDILFFSSGYKVIPPIKFSLGLEFLHEVEKNGLLSQFPKANTCACTLRLPTLHKRYEDFKQAMAFALLNTKGFGCP